jgi:hypothetical protein
MMSPRQKLKGRMMHFADGGSDKYKAKFDRKIADIESDYQKALKKGKNEGVAKAKYEQRMADAKDDLAKWTKGDRTQTSAAEKAAEKALTEARRTKGASMMSKAAEAPKAAETPKAETPKAKSYDDMSFGKAFAAARKDMLGGGDKTFTWKGKSYGTDLAGDKPKTTTRRQAQVLSEPSKPANAVTAPNLDPRVAKYAKVIEEARKRGSSNVVNPNSREVRAQAASTRNYFGKDGSIIGYQSEETRKAKRDKIIAEGEKPGASTMARNRAKFYKENPNAMKKGGKVKKYAKGGSVSSVSKRADGCAIRGKTRAR